MKHQYRILLGILLCALMMGCSNSEQGKYTTENQEKKEDTAVHSVSNIPLLEGEDFEVLNLDLREGELHRIFVYTQVEEIMDIEAVQNMVCTLEHAYETQRFTCFSFISNRTYCKYKEEWMEELPMTKKDSIVSSWFNEQYIGEFELKTRKLTQYPVSRTHKSKVIDIEQCTFAEEGN